MALTVQEIERRVEYIRSIANDDESAHSEEDDLHVTVLKAIAENECNDPAGCAKAALSTLQIKFCRWCA